MSVRSRSVLFVFVGLGVLALALIAGLAPASRAAGVPCKFDVDRSLWIRDLSVVEDPLRTTWVENPTNPSQGAWTFGRLMQSMAGNHDVSEFVLELFNEFDVDQNINGFDIPARPTIMDEIIDPWIEQSKANGFKGLDFSIAPFRLNGFVNRIDLRTNSSYGAANSAGEGRIVFSVLRPEGQTSLFTLILEYELLADDCQKVQSWAAEWAKLSELKFGKAYNAQLEKLVNAFAGANAAPGRPNGSAIHQVRTNEVVGLFPWQWREFHLSAQSGFLEQATVAQSIPDTLNASELLRDYVNQNEAEILAGEHVVPFDFQGQPFRGGASNGEPLTAFFAAKGINNNDARHLFSLNNCVACHTDETGTNFFHSNPRNAGSMTFLSDFLTGTTIPDPVDPGTKRSFNDLKRRSDDLCKLLNSSCADLAEEKPLVRVH